MHGLTNYRASVVCRSITRHRRYICDSAGKDDCHARLPADSLRHIRFRFYRRPTSVPRPIRHVRFRFTSKSTREFRYVTSSGGFWRDRPLYFRSTGYVTSGYDLRETRPPLPDFYFRFTRYVTSGSGCCRNRLPTSARPTPRSHPLPVLSNSTPASPPDYGPGRDVISVSSSCRIRRRLSRTGQATGCRIQVPGDPYRPATRHRQHTARVCSQSPRRDTAACDVFAPASQRQVSKQIHGVTVTTEFRHFVGMT